MKSSVHEILEFCVIWFASKTSDYSNCASQQCKSKLYSIVIHDKGIWLLVFFNYLSCHSFVNYCAFSFYPTSCCGYRSFNDDFWVSMTPWLCWCFLSFSCCWLIYSLKCRPTFAQFIIGRVFCKKLFQAFILKATFINSWLYFIAIYTKFFYWPCINFWYI